MKNLLLLSVIIISFLSCSESSSDEVSVSENPQTEYLYPSGTWGLSTINNQNVSECLSNSTISINESQEVVFISFDEDCNSYELIGFMELLINEVDYIISVNDIYRVIYDISDDSLRLDNAGSSMVWEKQ